jgi:hypothetical protein
MSCCGRARAAFTLTPALPTGGVQIQPHHRDDVAFEFTGRTGMTVRGPVTGTVYRFQRIGAKVFVRARDSAALAMVPRLRRVSW